MRLWRRRRTGAQGLSCSEIVELVTDYFEGCLDPSTNARFEAHISLCDGCREYIDQLRKTQRFVGELREDHLSAPVRERLISAFRQWGEGVANPDQDEQR